VSDIKWWSKRRYTAWYTPLYRIRDADYQHCPPEEPRLIEYIKEIKHSILAEGLLNPLLVTIRPEGATIHPGKCRAKALLELGWEYAPAVVVDFTRVVDASSLGKWCVFLDDKEAISSLFTGDCVVEMSYKGLVVKKLREQ